MAAEASGSQGVPAVASGGVAGGGTDVVELLTLWERRSASPVEPGLPGAGAARVHRGKVILPEGVLDLPGTAREDVPQSAVATGDGRWCLVSASPGASELSRLHVIRRDRPGDPTAEGTWTLPGRGARGRPAVLSAGGDLALWIAGDGHWSVIDLTGDQPRHRSLPTPALFEASPGARLLASQQPLTWWVSSAVNSAGGGADPGPGSGVRLDRLQARRTPEGWGLVASPGPLVPGLRRFLETRVDGSPALILHHAEDEGERLTLHVLAPAEPLMSGPEPLMSGADPQSCGPDPRVLWEGSGLRSLALVPSSGQGSTRDRLVVLRRRAPGDSELIEVPLTAQAVPRTLLRRSLVEDGEVLLSVHAQGRRLSLTSGSPVRPARVAVTGEDLRPRAGTQDEAQDEAHNEGEDAAAGTERPPPRSGVEHAVSADGTQVPFTWHARAGLEEACRRRAPVMLTVYGGFGVEIGDVFDPSARAWCEAGGVHLLAHVRGGGELGPAWHRGGAGVQKHRSVEDLLAVAAHLAAEVLPGSPVSVVGASMGGVLAAAAAARRPELFSGLVVSGAPVDLSRVEENPLGHLWREELLGCSPGGGESPSLTQVCPTHLWRHRLEGPEGGMPAAGPALPAVLAIAQENDTRVEAGHLRDLISLMQEHGMAAELRVNPGAGHGRNTAEAVHRYAAWILGFCQDRRQGPQASRSEGTAAPFHLPRT